MKCLVDGSLHQHLRLNLLSIISQIIVGLANELKFITALRLRSKRACDEDNGKAPHAVPSCGMRGGRAPCIVVSKGGLAQGTPVSNSKSLSDNVDIPYTLRQSRRHLQPDFRKKNLLIAFNQQFLRTSLPLLIRLPSWLAAKRSARKKRSILRFWTTTKFGFRTTRKTSWNPKTWSPHQYEYVLCQRDSCNTLIKILLSTYLSYTLSYRSALFRRA